MADEEYGLVMPFVVCASQAGPYADEPFVAGYDMGYLDGLLDARPATLTRAVRTACMPQVDLIAMKHGYSIRATEEPGYPEWTSVDLVPSK